MSDTKITIPWFNKDAKLALPWFQTNGVQYWQLPNGEWVNDKISITFANENDIIHIENEKKAT
jgi:hypothetical protein